MARTRGMTWAALGVGVALMGASATDAGAGATRFEVRYDEALHPGPLAARVYVMLGPAGGSLQPRMGPNWFRPQPFFAVDAVDWRPGEPLLVDGRAAGFPASLDELAAGVYDAQAVVRLNPDTHELGTGAGNAFGPVVTVNLDGDAQAPILLTIDTVVAARPFAETDQLKLVELDSPLLSRFHGRPIRHRAAVILPRPEAAIGPQERFPSLYIIPGFGGDHFMARGLVGGRGYGAVGRDLVRIVLDPDCGTGHHAFADSENNGPRGEALITELIPHIEARFPIHAEPAARLLTGHSSGGWSSLWLQVAYPRFFGGVWSTSPDPVDFRDFQQIDLYKSPDVSMFVDPEGRRRPLARRGDKAVIWYDDFSRMEDVIGAGGQLHSFEAVFSPRGPDGRPRPLWDRRSGQVDPEVARAWERYDISLQLERRWDALKADLAGKLHVTMGGLDTFYLEGATRLLEERLEALGSDAEVQVIEGKDHGSVLDNDVLTRIDQEIHAHAARFLPATAGAAQSRGEPAR